ALKPCWSWLFRGHSRNGGISGRASGQNVRLKTPEKTGGNRADHGKVLGDKELTGSGENKPGDVVFTLLVGGFLAFMVRVVGPRIAFPEGLPVRGYGVCLVVAILLSTLLILWQGRKRNISADSLLSVVFVSVICGILGARIFYVVEYWPVISQSDGSLLFNILDMTSGGLVVYGSIIGGILSVFVFLYLKKMPILATFDLFAPALMLGIAIGRIGCLMNGCCFGGVCDFPWGITFPAGSFAHVEQMEHGKTSLYGLTLQGVDFIGQTPERNLVGLKPEHRTLASTEIFPPTIAAVDSESPAEQAGLSAGMVIRRLGCNFDSDGQQVPSPVFYAVRNNEDVFNFFLFRDWKPEDHKVYIQVVKKADDLSERQNGEDSPETGNGMTDGKNGGSGQLQTIVFHPVPSRVLPVHPTQLYSSCTALILCLVLLTLSHFCRRDGLVFAWMLILYPVNRFLLELIRTDETSFLGTGMTVAQCVSLVVCLFGIVLLILIHKGAKKEKRSII
ncbi:MAG: prolipoprotein diacylglyceryl transferase, partial [Thermoguttaceae bacterium]|nr:prolipoprotein diacylglyceryl transferase [Thermoguttaceae bacterium]